TFGLAALLLCQVQGVVLETKHRRKGRLECPPGPDPCTCNCAEKPHALSNLMTQMLPGGPPPPPKWPQLPEAPPAFPPPPPAAPRAPPLPPPPPPGALADLPEMPDVNPEDLPTLGPVPQPPLLPCNLEEAKSAPWLLRIPCNLTEAPELVSMDHIPEGSAFPFQVMQGPPTLSKPPPVYPVAPAPAPAGAPLLGGMTNMASNLPGTNMMKPGIAGASLPTNPLGNTMNGMLSAAQLDKSVPKKYRKAPYSLPGEE
ncbi:unnamed protein product, partial [Durusdinium trenchii]